MKRILLTQSTHINFNPFVPSIWQPTTQWCCWYLRSSDARMAVISSVAKSAVFPRNWATLHCCHGLFFMSAGWSDPNKVIFSPWNANFTGGSPPKNVYFTPWNAIFTGEPPSKRDGLVLSSNWAGFVAKTWQPWSAGAVDNPRVRWVGWLKNSDYLRVGHGWIR